MESSISYVTTEDKQYYRIDWGRKATYTPISETEFYNDSRYKKPDIQRLRKSVYPTQGNDYLLMKSGRQYFPVDYKLAPFVRYLWKNNIKTEGWDQPDGSEDGFVSMDHYTKKKESTLAFLQDILKEMPVKVLDRRGESLARRCTMDKKVNTLNKKGFFVIELFENFLSMSLNDTLMETLYNHLGLPMNEERLPGAGIVSEPYFKHHNIVKRKTKASPAH